MKTQIGKLMSGIMAVLMLLSMVPAYTIEAGGADLSEAENEDNWSIGIVFYDSYVDDGKTPLYSIDWDASDGGYGSGTPRVITVQVNYINTNAVTTYEPGDLSISIPNLIYSLASDLSSAYAAQWTASVAVSTINPQKPEDPNEVWTFMDGKTSPSASQKTFTFTNNQSLEELTNFEGSFQIQYTIVPASETPEKYLDECTHEYEKDLQAELTGKANESSNTLDFDYRRTYVHPWKKPTYTIDKALGDKINSYDGLGPGAANYIWVRYKFTVKRSVTSTSYPYITCSPLYFTDEFPADCVIFDSTGEKIEPEDNMLSTGVSFSSSSTTATYTYLVGYPKSRYNVENGNTEFENTAKLYGRYLDESEDRYLDEDSVDVRLEDFVIPDAVPGAGITLSKSGQTYFECKLSSNTATRTKSLHYQSIIDNDQRNMIRWTIRGTVPYWGAPLTVEFGDDLIYHTHTDGALHRTADDEYYFENIIVPAMKNANDLTIPSGKYKFDVFVRYAGESENQSEYVKFNDEPYLNSTSSQTITFPDTNVVAWFIRIYDMNESLMNFAITTDMYFTAGDIPQAGKIYNFDYLKVYAKDGSGNLTHVNPASEAGYNEFIEKDEIIGYDEENYGGCIQRASANKDWVYYQILDAAPSQRLTKENVGSVILSAKDEYFYGEFKVSDRLSARYDGSASSKELFEQLKDTDFFTDFTFYDLLPEGMELMSTEEEIFNTITATSSASSNVNFYDKNGNRPFASNAEVTSFLKERSVVTVTKNWNNTGRTRIKIEIDFSDLPLFCYGDRQLSNSGAVAGTHSLVTFQYRYGIPFDSYLAYGNAYKNYAYLQSRDTSSLSTKIEDNGQYDPDASDITEDGQTTDLLAYSSANAVINYLVSTHQDLTKFVLTDKIDDYKTGSAQSSPGAEYSYKIRVRSGQSDITNLVIYDSIEENAKDKDGNIVPAYGDNEHWQGEFLGVDTSFAKNRSYTVRDKNNPDNYVIEKIDVKVWYSKSPNPGELYANIKTHEISPNWEEYPEDDSAFDKSEVKSLAFEFLDQNGDGAVLPTNISTYVIIKMRAPDDAEITTLAYNGSWTQWQALDDNGMPVDFITGINSNIVKVSLNEVVDVVGAKTWVGDKPEYRPEEITVVLLQDGVEYQKTTTSANEDWKYSFDGLPKYRADGTEFEYSIREIYTEGYSAAYKQHVDGLKIKFNELSQIYSYYNYIELYYEQDGVVYKSRQYQGSALSNAVIEVPADNFYIYFYVNSSNRNYFGFMIDSVEPADRITTQWTEVNALPGKVPVECVGSTYPESQHDPHESTSTLWHYTYETLSDAPYPGAFNIVNTDAHIDIEGEKRWAADVEEFPESVTVKLLRDGEVYRTLSVTADANGEWKYVFEGVPKFREDGTEYEYSVEEGAMSGFLPIYGASPSGLAIKFNEQSETEGISYDYVYVYYELDGVIYRQGPYGGKNTANNIANTVVEVPANNFWLYWRTNGSGNNYYGFSIDSVEILDKEADTGAAVIVDALPNYAATELAGNEYPETPHLPYNNSANVMWHYTTRDVVWSSTAPQAGLYYIMNTVTYTDYPDTGGNAALLILYEALGWACVLTGVFLAAGRKKKKKYI